MIVISEILYEGQKIWLDTYSRLFAYYISTIDHSDICFNTLMIPHLKHKYFQQQLAKKLNTVKNDL